MAAFKSKDENHDSYEDFNSDKNLVRGDKIKKVGTKSAKTPPCANTKKETAEYIGGMIVELREMADSSDHVFLAYLLDMAYEEAVSAANKS